MYYIILGPCITALLPLSFTVIVGIAIVIGHYTKKHYWAVYALMICIIYITALIQWSIGGVYDSGFVMAWALCGPITALAFFSLRQAAFWLALYFINIVITVYFNHDFSARSLYVSDGARLLFFIMNIGVSSLVVFAFAGYFVSNTMKERAQVNALLLNILPEEIANKLKTNQGSIAQRHDEVCVLFADIVGFTNYSSLVSPEELVAKLDTIFRSFDMLAAKYKLEKIKTIGDSYMLAGGIPLLRENCTEHMGNVAIEMHRVVAKIQKVPGSNFTIKIGMHFGQVVAGVIGGSKFAYDLWGDTVNIASRLESTCEEGKIHVSEQLRNELEENFLFEHRGEIEMKGKGVMETYYLVGRKKQG